MDVVKRNFAEPDEEHKAGRSKVQIIHAGGVTHKSIVFYPGWRWSDDVGPESEDKLCQLLHVFVHVSGTFRVKMIDDSVHDFGPGDVSVIPPGHDAWVDGDESVIVIDHTPEQPAKPS